MNIQIIRTFLVFISLSLLHYALASKIEVVNENKKPLKVRIIPEDTTETTKELPADARSTFSVESKDLQGDIQGPYYAIKGDTNPLTAGDKCRHLSVQKDYKVTFLDDAMGTTCVAEEIKKSS